MKQNINYIGSKYSLLDFIYTKISLVETLHNKVFCDIFSGTNIVGMFFKDKVKQVISNDLEYFSYVIGKKYLNNSHVDCDNLISELNSLSGVAGNIFNFYSNKGKSERMYFSEENGKKIDAIRIKIEEWKNDISDEQYFYLLTSLLEAADKIANTTSVYGAYLKEIKKSAQRNIILKNVEVDIIEKQTNICYNEDANSLIKNIEGDILYIDTPYNHRQYGSNYHILNAIAKYDFTVTPKGVTGMMDYNKSKYCSKVSIKNEFKELIDNAKFEHIFISYNSEGILKVDDFKEFLIGDLQIFEIDYKTYKSDNKRNNKSENVIEYLFYLKKCSLS